MNEVNKFELASKVDFTPLVKTKGKNGAEYAPWGSHWGEFKKVYPNGSFEFIENDDGGYVFKEVVGEEVVGYMVKVAVCDGEETPTTLKISRPIMTHQMKASFTFTSKEVSDTLFRCLAKACSLFGSGLTVFAGEEYFQYEIGEALDKARADILEIAKKITAIDEKKRIDAINIIGNDGKVKKIRDVEEAQEKQKLLTQLLTRLEKEAKAKTTKKTTTTKTEKEEK